MRKKTSSNQKREPPRLLCSRYSGFCFGVQRAIHIALDCAGRQGKKIRTLGPIIHNPGVVQDLQAHGIRSVKNFAGMKRGETLIIRSHGIPEELENKIRAKGIHLVDATCPFVKKAQNLVSRMSRDGCDIILIIGEKCHPEVEGLISYGCSGRVHVVETLNDLKKLKLYGRVGVVFQTTQSPDVFVKFIRALKRRKDIQLQVHNTICLETSRRQKEAVRLAAKVDLILVVGGKNSANTSRLYHRCRAINRNACHIENAGELTRRRLAGAKTIGIVSGASTPLSVVQQIMKKIGELCPEK